ncbi:MAG: type IV toxin-antitoxin system AbiEi family antitoxin domain-containing protein [bacterium]
MATRQHGVLAVSQLREIGLTTAAIHHRVAGGHLHRTHRGVYAVGHKRLTRKGRFLAAVLACGPAAAISHRSAASLLDLRPSARAQIDITVSDRTVRSRPGIRAHRATLLPRDVTTIDHIPCTSVARTLLDLAGELDAAALDRALQRAEVLRVLDTAGVQDVLDRGDGHRGVAKLDHALTLYLPEIHTRSELEARFLALCRSASLPSPVVNGRIEVGADTLEVDFHWPSSCLVVETDGHATHGTRAAFERDRRRDQMLTAAGWRVLRFTWRQLARRPDEVAGTVRAALGCAQAAV